MRQFALLCRLGLPGVILVLLGGACGGGGESVELAESAISPRGSFAVSTTSDAAGKASAEFSLPQSVSKFAVTIHSSAPLVLVDSIISEPSVVYLNPDEFISLSQELQPLPIAANVPSRSFDPSVSGGIFTVTVDTVLGAALTPASGANVDFAITTAADSDLSSGTLPVNLFFVGSTAQTVESKEAVAVAQQEMERIFSSQANISLSFTEIDLDGSTVIPDPFNGSALYANAAASAPSPAVNIFFGADVEAFESGTAFGITGSIPAPPIPTERSAVAIGLIASAGPDGSFSDTDLRFLGETMAHETGHFVGLFHPVEVDPLSGSVSEEDPLPDTASCANYTECVSNQALAGNLMFPFPVVSGGDLPIHQDNLTEQQVGVVNRYVAVN